MAISDSELLEAYALRGSAEAFGRLAERHGAPVYAACLRVLGNAHEAEDAAQAVFVALARSARSIRRGSALAAWLHRVALLVAAGLVRERERRARHEKEAARMRAQLAPAGGGPAWDDLRPALDRAVNDLPDRYRLVLVEHYLAGRPVNEVAAALGKPEGTVKSLLSRAVEKLRARLGRQGVSVPAAALGGMLAAQAGAAAAPAALLASLKGLGAGAAAAPVSATAASLAEGAMKAMMIAKVKLAAVVVGAVLAVGGGGTVAVRLAAAEPGPAVPSGPGTTILDTGSFWRCHFASSAPLARINGELQEISEAGSAGPLQSKLMGPPAGWAEPDFDDSAWVRVPGPFFPSQRGHAYSKEAEGMGFIRFEETSPRLALICLRGGFQVTDPGAAKGLRLSLSFRGGAVAYLNGQEIARAHLPKDKLDAAALAEDYPQEAFVTAAGSPILYAVSPEVRDRLPLRIRSLGDVALPAKLLRKGRNVLAVEVRRAPYHEAVMLGKAKKTFYGNSPYDIAWTTAGVTQLTMRAYGAGAVPNDARPGGFQLWNADPLVPAFETDYGEAGESPRPIRLVGTPNGRFAGQVVAGCNVPIKGLSAKISDLALEGGTGRIAASAVSIRYPLPASGEQWYQDVRPRVPGAKGVACFDALMESPPAEVPVRTRPMQGAPPAVFGAVQPIWITVSVPPGAAAGEYRGKLTVGADGQQPVDVPVHLKVCAWELPDPRDFRTFVDFIQSPETLALQYDAPLWSEKHLAMLDQSLKWLGSVGNKTVYIPLICRTNFGNEQSMVRWIKQADGSYKHDFTAVDQYLDLVEKHLGKPPVVCLYVWDLYAGGGLYGAVVKEWKPVLVSELDAASGKVQEMAGPTYNEAEKARAFWKPVAESLRERLKQRGLEKSLMIGIVSDIIPDQEVVACWKEILPEAKWVSMAHALKWEVRGVPVGYASTVWQASFAPDPSVERCYGWDKPWDKRKGLAHGFVTQFARVPAIVLTPQTMLLDYAYLAGERNITGMQNGAGRMPADFWPVLKNAHSAWGASSRCLAARYPESNWKQLNFDDVLPYLRPGPAGAVSTLRFEAIRQGLQECEARIFIESALLDKARRAKLGAELAERCQAFLDERTRALRSAGEGAAGGYGFVASGWQERAGKLYAAAAEVAAKTGGK